MTPARILITGNAGSGKTWLGERLSTRLGASLFHLDDVVWDGPYGGKEREKPAAFAEAERLAAAENWVIEGVYGWLVPTALPRATEFVFIDLPVDECIANLRARGQQGGGDAAAFEKMLDWVAGYPTRTNANSRATHERQFTEFPGTKHRLTTRDGITSFWRQYPDVSSRA